MFEFLLGTVRMSCFTFFFIYLSSASTVCLGCRLNSNADERVKNLSFQFQSLVGCKQQSFSSKYGHSVTQVLGAECREITSLLVMLSGASLTAIIVVEFHLIWYTAVANHLLYSHCDELH